MATEKKLDPSLVQSRKEVVVQINLRSLAKAYSKLFHDKPVELYQAVARKADVVSKKMMTGYSSAVSMPLGIMVRNGARVASEATSAGRWSGVGIVAGAIGALASVYFGTTLGAAYLQETFPAMSGALGTTGAMIASGAVSTVFLTTPAFTAGELATATVCSAAATAVSVLPAVLNVPVALRRSKDRAVGIVYDNDVFDKKVEEESLDTQYRRAKMDVVMSNLYHLSDEQKQQVVTRISDDFAKAAAQKAEEEAKAARKANRGKPVAAIEEALVEADKETKAVIAAPKGPGAGPA
jgi:hypothetical protein